MSNPSPRTPIPLLTSPHRGGRSALTCRFRCGNQCAHDVANTSGNTYFGDMVAETVSRRGVLRAGAIGAIGALALGAGATTSEPAFAASGAAKTVGLEHAAPRSLGFVPVTPTMADALIVPDGYEAVPLACWGDPVLPDAPAFDFENQTAEAQAKQFGYNCDFVAFFPLGKKRGLLWVNHEHTNEILMFRGYTNGDTATEEQIKVGLVAHGGSVIELERVGQSGRWKMVTQGARRYNRRITARTPMRFAGPAAGSDLLKTAADPEGTTPIGMINNCSGGTTPWGTVLSGEENFNYYFVNGPGAPEAQKPFLDRYSISSKVAVPADSRRFDRVEERFDLAKHPNEAHRFGWVVEIDPFDPDSVPVKHTALGRMNHEGATTTLAKDGRVVVYMGDDSRFEYVYKFVSAESYIPGNDRHNRTLLDEGTLYVAKFTGDSPAAEIDGSGKLPADGEFDGSGTWIPLVTGDVSHVPGMSAEEVLVYTRVAADKVGATKMDRPEDIERNPVTGAVYASLTKNDRRTPAQVDEVNPRAVNKNGQILEIVERRNDAGAETFSWSLPLVCGDPADPSTYYGGFDKGRVSAISCPDNLTFDADGNLWIATDGNDVIGANDGLFVMPVRGPERGYVRRFASIPVGGEACGPLVSPDQRSVFLAIQHPGETDGATVDTPSSHWPDGGTSQPRPAVAVIWHKEGKRVGS